MSSTARKIEFDESSENREINLYQVGDVVQHMLFGYRGVIIGQDPKFLGDEESYEKLTQSQPPKEQPWYHILIDGTESMTYVAESHLTNDASAEPIDHPLASIYFDAFEDGRYFRIIH